jgi:NhaP-type Na+/H+ or K+/H+ antiporter
VAAVSLIDIQKEPKLFSKEFGEGVTNDAVSNNLFNTVFKYTGAGEKFSTQTIFKIGLEFVKLALSSVGCGLVASFACALFLKHMRFLTHSPVHETLFVFCFGYLGYMFSELFELSGIITLLTSGVLMAHYAWYNLSPQSKQTTSLAFGAIGFGAEAFVFAYLGLSFFSYTTYEWSWQFFVAEFLVVIVGRFLGIIGLLYVVSFILNHERELTFKESLFLYCGGMIRGAIAFGLVLRLDQSLPNRQVIITTSLCLVIVTTLLFGTLMPLLSKFLLGGDDDEAHGHGHGHGHAKKEEKDGEELEDLSGSAGKSEPSVHELLIHPNFENEESMVANKPKKKSG